MQGQNMMPKERDSDGGQVQGEMRSGKNSKHEMGNIVAERRRPGRRAREARMAAELP